MVTATVNTTASPSHCCRVRGVLNGNIALGKGVVTVAKKNQPTRPAPPEGQRHGQ